MIFLYSGLISLIVLFVSKSILLLYLLPILTVVIYDFFTIDTSSTPLWFIGVLYQLFGAIIITGLIHIFSIWIKGVLNIMVSE